MRDLILNLDYEFVDFLRNMSVKVGQEQTSQALKVSELSGLQLPKSLSPECPPSDKAGNVFIKYLQKTVHEVFTPK